MKRRQEPEWGVFASDREPDSGEAPPRAMVVDHLFEGDDDPDDHTFLEALRHDSLMLSPEQIEWRDDQNGATRDDTRRGRGMFVVGDDHRHRDGLVLEHDGKEYRVVYDKDCASGNEFLLQENPSDHWLR